MSYIYNNFLKPISPGDRNIQIIDSTGKITYTINPFSITDTFISNNLIKINIKSQKNIILDFYSTIQAQQALITLQGQIDTLIQNVPFVISKDLENFIINQVAYDTSQISNLNGVTFSGDILPSVDSFYNIGHQNQKWNNLYLSNSAIINGVTISAFDGGLNVDKINLGPSFSITSIGNKFNFNSSVSAPSILIDGVTVSSSNNSIIVPGLNLGTTASPFVFTTNGSQLIFNGTTSLPISYDNLENLPFIHNSFNKVVATNDVILNNNTLNFVNGLTESAQISSTTSSLVLKTYNSSGATTSTYEWNLSNGTMSLPTDGDISLNGESIIVKYYGTSSTPLQLPQVGYVVNLTTQKRLSYRPMQELLCYDIGYQNYMIDDYVDDSGTFFTGTVDSYNSTTGQLSLVVDYSSGWGLTNNSGIVPTYSNWHINIGSPNFANNSSSSVTIGNPTSSALLTSDGTSTGINANSNVLLNDILLKIKTTSLFQQTIEKIAVSSSNNSIVNYSFTQSSIWFQAYPTQDWIANITNVLNILRNSNGGIVTFTIVILQGSVPYIPQIGGIDGNIVRISWVNDTVPSGTPNGIDVIGLSLLYPISLFGQLSSFPQPGNYSSPNTEPIVTTTTISGTVSGGYITSDGGAPILQCGVVYATHSNTELYDYFTNNGTASSFSSTLSLNNIDTWYYRAYAINNIGIGYGSELSVSYVGP